MEKFFVCATFSTVRSFEKGNIYFLKLIFLKVYNCICFNSKQLKVPTVGACLMAQTTDLKETLGILWALFENNKVYGSIFHVFTLRNKILHVLTDKQLTPSSLPFELNRGGENYVVPVRWMRINFFDRDIEENYHHAILKTSRNCASISGFVHPFWTDISSRKAFDSRGSVQELEIHLSAEYFRLENFVSLQRFFSVRANHSNNA